MSRTSRRAVAVLAVLVAALLAGCGTAPPPSGPEQAIPVRIVAFNDLHGNLEPPDGSSGRVTRPDGSTVQAGGAAFLATHLRRLLTGDAALVSTGDNVGASPVTSALFHDEPTIDLLDGLGVRASAAGNHEFDEGYAELERLQRGGCHPVDGCRFRDPFPGARFPVLSANVTRDGAPALPASTVIEVGGVRVGVIGATLRALPTLVSADAIAGLAVGDEVEAVNRASDALEREGVRAQIVLLHQGDERSDACPAGGAATEFARAASPAVDAVFTAHTHQEYVCSVPDPAGAPRPVVQGLSFGRLVSVVDLRVDPTTRDVLRPATRAENVVVTRDVPPDPAAAALVDEARTKAAPIANQPVGRIATELARTATPAGESPLGSVVADAQLAATRRTGAVAALTNPGGVRADLTFASSPAGEGDGVVTYGQAYAVQPFGNVLQTVTLTGAGLKDALEQQFALGKTLQVSDTLRYTASAGAPVGSKVSGLTIGGAPVDPGAPYRITVNNFLTGGGDGFTTLARGADVVGGEVDLDALVAYLRAAPVLAAPAPGRITAAP